jgi:3',5'-cyclic AMP phosphodiesterase CpdA
MPARRDLQRPIGVAFASVALLGAAGCNGGQPTATASTPKPALVRSTTAATSAAPAPAPARAIPLIAAAGDIACPPGQQPAADSCHQAGTAQVLSALNPDAVLPLGDLQYDIGALADYNASFDPTWGQFKSRMYPVPGNHEYYTAGAAGYLGYFGHQARPKGTTWYSYNLGTWHLVALDSNCDIVGCGPTSKQVRWLARDLRASHRRCTLAYWHHPRWTGGKYTDQTQVRTLYATLYAAGADLILAGHDHGYQRFAKLDPSGHVNARRGIQTFVVGTGGRSHYPKGRRANLLAANSAVFGVLALRLKPGGWSWRFVPEPGGTFADSGTASCH